MSMQVCNGANACFCVYVSISVFIFPVSDLISVTQKERKDIRYIVFRNCPLYEYYVMRISNEVL